MSQSFRHCFGPQSVPLLAMVAVLLASAPLLADDGGKNPQTVWLGGQTDPMSEFAKGVYAMETGMVLKAVDHLEVAWRDSGREVVVGRKLAEGYFMLKNFTRSEMVADDILARDGKDYDALLLKAKIRYIRRDRAASVSLLESIRAAHGTHFEVERFLGNIYYEAGNDEEALEAYAKCVNANPSYPYIHYRYGSLLARNGRYAEAEAALSKAIELDPDLAEPRVRLAELYLETDRPEDAVPVLEDVVAMGGANTQTMITLANLYLDLGRLDQGIKLLESQRADKPLPREGEIVLGRLYYEAREYDEAFTIFADLFEKEKNSPELARILGEISLKSGDPERSRGFFDAAIEIDPGDYRNYLGKFFAATPDFSSDGSPVIDLSFEERAGLLSKASEMVDAADFDGNYLLGVSYISVDSLETSRRHLMRAYEARNDDEGTLLNLANVYEKLGRYEDAQACLEKLHALKPTDATICNFFGYLLAEMGKDLDKAESLVREALKQEPDNGYYLDSLGWVYYQKGDYASAVIELEKASQRISDDPVILEHLGDAYRALRRFDKARTAYERSSQLQDGNSEILEKIKSTNP